MISSFIKNLIVIAKYTFLENIRNKIIYVLILSGVILTGSTILLAILSGEQQIKVLLDLGLAVNEFFGLIIIVFASVTIILEEIESKTIYLIITRPISKYTYLLGRYLGVMLAVYIGMFLMGIFHIVLLVLKGWQFSWKYPIALIFSLQKITLIGSIAIFFSLFSSSAISSAAFTIFFWILGHFSEEFKFLSLKLKNIFLKFIAIISYYIFPNLQFLNMRDFWDVPSISYTLIGISFLYTIVYTSFFVFLSILLFTNKEF